MAPMDRNTALLLAFIAGAMLAMQAAFNARLGALLGNAPRAAGAAFVTASICVLGLSLLWPSGPEPTPAVPLWLWCAGGLLSAVAVSTCVVLIPRVGMAPVITLTLTGQLLAALVAGHFGWLGLPVSPLTPRRTLGALVFLIGAWMVTYDNASAG